jgi:hypothetical protein
VRKILFTLVLALLCGLVSRNADAATFKLSDGRTLTGELIDSGSNDATALINVGDNKYERIAWGMFSQDDLKSFLEKFGSNKKITEAVEPFIEISQEERAKKTEVPIKAADPVVQELQKGRLEPKGSVIGSLFHSGLGVFLVLLIYGANIYAGFEIGVFRAQPLALVPGLAAIPVLGFLSNIIFLALPTRVEKKVDNEALEAVAEARAATFAMPGQESASPEAVAAAEHAHAATAAAKPEVYSRGQFTFNKRFFETKFANFFGMIRREEDRAKVLTFKTTKGELTIQRITRITPTEIYVQVERGGGASVETGLGFQEIQEIVLRQHA